jgi:hypothetical protein
MHIYKFRILLEDNEQFFREIDIKATQTYEDFHKVLNSSAGFDGTELSSFYICDSKWNKLQEISICDLTDEEAEEKTKDFDDDEKPAKEKKAILTMCDTKLRDTINDPHQRIIYVYDFLKMHTFYIELYKIKEAEKGLNYPAIIKSQGEIHKPPTHIADGEEDLPDDIALDDEDDEPAPGEESLDGLYDDTLIN